MKKIGKIVIFAIFTLFILLTFNKLQAVSESNVEKINGNVLIESGKDLNEAKTSQADIDNKINEEDYKEIAIKYGITCASALFGIGFVVLILNGIKKYKDIESIEPSKNIKYYKKIPNINETPAEVAFLYYYRKGAEDVSMPRILSATLLDLALKKHIVFEKDASLPKKNQVTIKIINDSRAEKLKESEQLALDLFKSIPEDDENLQFNMKDFEKYVKKHNSKFSDAISKIQKQAEKEQIETGHFEKEGENKHSKWYLAGTLIIVILALLSLVIVGILNISILPLVFVIMPGVVYAVLCFAIGGKLGGITQKGIDEKIRWEAFEKYMKDYSKIENKEEIKIKTWEKYLVYAMLFGSAEQILKQIKNLYIQSMDNNSLNDTAFLHLMQDENYNDSFIYLLDSTIMTEYTALIASKLNT